MGHCVLICIVLVNCGLYKYFKFLDGEHLRAWSPPLAHMVATTSVRGRYQEHANAVANLRKELHFCKIYTSDFMTDMGY